MSDTLQGCLRHKGLLLPRAQLEQVGSPRTLRNRQQQSAHFATGRVCLSAGRTPRARRSCAAAAPQSALPGRAAGQVTLLLDPTMSIVDIKSLPDPVSLCESCLPADEGPCAPSSCTAAALPERAENHFTL